jgi:hypothetical protein
LLLIINRPILIVWKKETCFGKNELDVDLNLIPKAWITNLYDDETASTKHCQRFFEPWQH